MYFVVTAYSGGNPVCQNLGAVPGYANTGTMTSGGLVSFGNQLPYTYTTGALAGGLPAQGATISGVPVNSSDIWQLGDFGIYIGNDGGHAWIFQVLGINVSGAGTMDLYCVTPLFGNLGGAIGAFATLLPTTQPEVWFDNQQILGYSGGGGYPQTQPQKIKCTGHVTSSGGSVAITLPYTFSSSTQYRITGLVPFGSFTCYVSGKTASGFTINTQGGNGDIEYTVEGWEFIV